MSAFRSARQVRFRTLAASAGLALIAVTAGCAGTVATPGKISAAPISTRTSPATAPGYFLDIVQFSGAVSGGELQVRRAATGALVQQPPVLALGVAPLGGSAEFVVAELAGNRCASALYRTHISAAGRPGPLTRLGPLVHGQVTSLAAAENGRTVAYFAWPCSKSASGYLAALNVGSGHVRRWGDVSVEGSAGNITAGSDLSLSASGRLAIFSGAAAGAGAVTTQQVRTLSTSARAGTLAQRSHVVLTRSASGAQLDSVLLSPDGRSFYLCTVSTKGTVSAHRTVTQTTVITARRISSGARTGTLATLRATGVTFPGQGFGCTMAASPGDRYVLAPYTAKYASSSETGPLVRAARIDVATKAAAVISFRLPGSAGMSVATGVRIAW